METFKIYYNSDGWVCNRYPYNLEIEDENKFIEVPFGVFEQTLVSLPYKAWKVENGNLINTQYEPDPGIYAAQDELMEIENWFLQNDYKANKVMVGEWELDDPRFIAYKQERVIKRARQDELNELLK